MIHVCNFFVNMNEEKLLIYLKKCSFLKKELVYVGFVVSAEGLKIDSKKVKAILKWLAPRSATKIRYFHRMASF